ncbi:MAG: hypothetical protein WC819_01125 [Parcubacteria group bacterium]|jgi:hypothetical protein
MKKISVVSFLVLMFFFFLKASSSFAVQEIVSTCKDGNLSVYVTYPVIDTVGPGFGSQAVDRPQQLGTVVRHACYDPAEKRITAWRQGKYGVHAHYGGDEEELPEILSAKYGINAKKDHIVFETKTVISLPEGKVVSSEDLQLYYFEKENKNKIKIIALTIR